MDIQSTWITMIVGIALLTMGRRLFWLFIAVAGFYFGLLVASRFLADFEAAALPIAAILAIGGAILAFFLQRLALSAAGFLFGGYLALTILAPDTLTIGWPMAALFIGGGLTGALLATLVFNWALVILTALTGSLLIIQSAPIQPPLLTLLAATLFLIGMALQMGLFTQKNEL
jgi:hypothetical protein